jgi:hypothetical protein
MEKYFYHVTLLNSGMFCEGTRTSSESISEIDGYLLKKMALHIEEMHIT